MTEQNKTSMAVTAMGEGSMAAVSQANIRRAIATKYAKMEEVLREIAESEVIASSYKEQSLADILEWRLKPLREHAEKALAYDPLAE